MTLWCFVLIWLCLYKSSHVWKTQKIESTHQNYHISRDLECSSFQYPFRIPLEVYFPKKYEFWCWAVIPHHSFHGQIRMLFIPLGCALGHKQSSMPSISLNEPPILSLFLSRMKYLNLGFKSVVKSYLVRQTNSASPHCCKLKVIIMHSSLCYFLYPATHPSKSHTDWLLATIHSRSPQHLQVKAWYQ